MNSKKKDNMVILPLTFFSGLASVHVLVWARSLWYRIQAWKHSSQLLDELVEEMRSGEPPSQEADDPETYSKLVYRMFSDALTTQDHARRYLPTLEQTARLEHTVHILKEVLDNPEKVHIEIVNNDDI